MTTQIDQQVSRLFGRDSVYMLLWAAQLLCAAGFTPVITRLLGTGEMGVVASSIAIMQVLFVFAGSFLATAVQREYERAGGRVNAARILTVAMLIAALVALPAAATIGWWARPLGLAGEGVALRLAVAWAAGSAVTAVSLALLRSQDRLLRFALVSLTQSVLAEAASLAIIAGDRRTGADFLYGRVLAQGAALLLAVLLTRPRAVRLRDLPMVRDAMGFALPLVPAVLGTFVLSTADRLIVQGLMGNDAVARYQVAYNIASAPMLLLAMLYSMWMPRFFAVSGQAERAAVIAAGRDVLYRLMVPLIGGLTIGAPIILRLWAPPSYRMDELAWTVLIVVVTAVPFSSQLAASQALTTQGRTVGIAVATLVAALANVLLNLVLVPRYGLTGSAVATLASYGLLAAFLGHRARLPAAPWLSPVRLGGATFVAVLATAAPTTGWAFWIRALLVVLSVAWFLFILAGLREAPRPPTRRWSRRSSSSEIPRARRAAPRHSAAAAEAGRTARHTLP
ncbi:oligosaccharide flippase family protein [Actinoplanes sp. NPDC049118]|uniref:lipopolysaccharide biosynthesis protein n=1 Tax=Actinoplanes sp. NPDC049118 TaxID=3155769 RepID=UPI0033C26415